MEDQPTPDIAPPVWPAALAEHGAVYGFQDGNHGPAVTMVAMLLSTWQHIEQEMSAMKTRVATLAQENAAMKQGRHPEGPRIFLPGR